MAKATQSEFNTLKQIYEQIPGHSVNKAVQIFGEDKRSRTFSPRRVLKKKIIQVMYGENFCGTITPA
jgi:hypothetical protein